MACCGRLNSNKSLPSPPQHPSGCPPPSLPPSLPPVSRTDRNPKPTSNQVTLETQKPLMAKEGGEAAGRPAGASLRRVTQHDKIISSAGHCCCDRTTSPSLAVFLLLGSYFCTSTGSTCPICQKLYLLWRGRFV